jgi:hypothetical protein
MAKHYKFLRNEVPSLLRVGNNSFLCLSAQGENCSCNGVAYSFSDVADLEAQLLNPSSTQGVNTIGNVKPETSIGLENFSIRGVCHTPNASECLPHP